MKNSSKHFSTLIIGLIFLNSQIHAQLVSGGTGHSIAICADGTINAWGLNDQNELGQGVLSANSCFCEATAVVVPVISGVTKVGAGGSHTLLLMNNGNIKAIGRNFDGELGNGMQVSSGCFCDMSVVDVIGVTDVIAVSSGNISSLALKSDSTVWGWGGDNFGQLGDGSANLTGCFCELTPVQAVGLSNVIAITNGSYHALALKSDGTVWAWGNNMSGQLGDGTTTSLSIPTQVAISNVVAIAAGQNHSYALKNDGTVWAWGDNSFGQLGTGTSTYTPLQVNGLSNVIAIANGFNHSIALKSDSTVWTWGANYSGQLGNGTSNGSVTPIMVNGLNNVTEIGNTMGNFCLAITNDGSVWSWGDNTWGSVGNGSSANALSPVLVQSLCNVPTSVNKHELKREMLVYPNPKSNAAFTIHIEGVQEIIQLEIFNILGKKVYDRQTYFDNKLSLDLLLNKGIYTVKITTENEKYSQKLIAD